MWFAEYILAGSTYCVLARQIFVSLAVPLQALSTPTLSECGGHKMTCGHCRRDSLGLFHCSFQPTSPLPPVGCRGFKKSFPSLKKSVPLVGRFLDSPELCFYLISTFLCCECPAFCFLFLLTTQTSMPPAGFELPIPASKRSQIYALVRAATGIGTHTPRFRGPMPYLLGHRGCWTRTHAPRFRRPKLYL